MSTPEFIPVNEPLLDGRELEYVTEAIRTGWISSEGEYVTRFEQAFAASVERRFGVAVANGTAALDIAVDALGIGPGDEVILPAFTIISCVTQIARCGAHPVFVDADPVTWNMDVSQVEAKITPRTRAIMVAHIYGLPVDMDPVIALCKKHNLKLIEDAAQAHGQQYKGAPCGSFGDVSTFSFYANKHVTTGEGGMLTCNDASLAETCTSLRNLCHKPGERFVHERLGWNYRLTNVQAALGLAQLEHLDQTIARKRAMGARYTERLADLKGLQLPIARTAYADNTYWVYGLVLDEGTLTAKGAMQHLAKQGIGTRPFFFPLHRQPVLQTMGLADAALALPHAERLYAQGFYLPSGLALTEAQIDRAAAAVRELLA